MLGKAVILAVVGAIGTVIYLFNAPDPPAPPPQPGPVPCSIDDLGCSGNSVGVLAQDDEATRVAAYLRTQLTTDQISRLVSAGGHGDPFETAVLASLAPNGDASRSPSSSDREHLGGMMEQGDAAAEAGRILTNHYFGTNLPTPPPDFEDRVRNMLELWGGGVPLGQAVSRGWRAAEWEEENPIPTGAQSQSPQSAEASGDYGPEGGRDPNMDTGRHEGSEMEAGYDPPGVEKERSYGDRLQEAAERSADPD